MFSFCMYAKQINELNSKTLFGKNWIKLVEITVLV